MNAASMLGQGHMVSSERPASTGDTISGDKAEGETLGGHLQMSTVALILF